MKRVLRWVLIPLVSLVLILVAVANFLADSEPLRPEDFAAQPITLPSGETLAFATYVERLERGDFEPVAATNERLKDAAEALDDEDPAAAILDDDGELAMDQVLFRWPPEPDPSDPFSMGRWAYHEGRFDEALALLVAVEPDHPSYDRAQRYVGWELLTKTQDRPRAGLAYMNRALNADPLGGENWQDAARVYLRAVGVRFDPVHGRWID